MKQTIAACMVVLGLCAGCASTPGHLAPSVSGNGGLSGHREVVLEVQGLSCPLCAHNLDGQLVKIEGVEEATIDLGSGTVAVQLAEGHTVSRERLAKAVHDAGFTLTEIRPQKAER